MGPAPPHLLLTSIRCPQVWRVNVTGPGCRHFLTCDRCLRAERFMGCGWCGDGCTRSHECNGTWVRDSCLPILTHVGPRRCPWPRGDLLESGQGGWGGRQNKGEVRWDPPSSSRARCPPGGSSPWPSHALAACPTVPPQERTAAGPDEADALRHDLPLPAGPHRTPRPPRPLPGGGGRAKLQRAAERELGQVRGAWGGMSVPPSPSRR